MSDMGPYDRTRYARRDMNMCTVKFVASELPTRGAYAVHWRDTTGKTLNRTRDILMMCSGRDIFWGVRVPDLVIFRALHGARRDLRVSSGFI